MIVRQTLGSQLSMEGDMPDKPWLPAEMRQTPSGQFLEEMLRIDPKLRAFYARRGSGGIALGIRAEDLTAALEVARGLPDDAGREALREALAPYFAKEPEVPDDGGSAWRNRTPYEVGPDFDRRAAEATVLTVRCMLPLPEEGRGWGYAILPGMAPVRRNAVVEHLLSLAKPVRCVAVGLGGMLAIGAWPTEPPREGTPGVFERRHGFTMEWLRTRYGHREARGLLVGQGEELVMTAQEIEEWSDQYNVPGVSLSWETEDPLVRERGVDFVVRFARMEVSEPDPEFDLE